MGQWTQRQMATGHTPATHWPLTGEAGKAGWWRAGRQDLRPWFGFVTNHLMGPAGSHCVGATDLGT